MEKQYGANGSGLVLDRSLALCGVSGRTKGKHVRKARFATPFVTYGSKDGKPVKLGHWKGGHRRNPHRK